jgi:3'-phosphoadenosine 5'-phosphosulfate sulfotransferase (PAPS reductase)/FAD synthetase
MSEIIIEAIEKYNPSKILLLFSGGHDSLCSTHYSSLFLKSIGVDFTVYHGNTGIGIRQTREYVYCICEQFGWSLYEGKAAPMAYEKSVAKFGFPGPSQHCYMYRNLKEKPLRNYVTHKCKSNPHARENVLLLTGIRRSESKIRMGYKDSIRKEASRIWCSPIFDWTKQDCDDYMKLHSLPRNPVKDKICISGECLCGAFSKKEEYVELKGSYPEAALEIERIHQIAIDNGKPWGWASNQIKHYKNNPPGQVNMFMCVGCEEKNFNNSGKI